MAKVELSSDKLALVALNSKQVKVSYKVYNQYGEDITSTNPTLIATASKGFATATSGILTINNASGAGTGASDTEFALGENVAVTLLDATTGTVAAKTLTVSTVSGVAGLEVAGLYNVDNKVLSEDSAVSDFSVKVKALDQYGNKMTATSLTNDVVATSSNPTVVNAGSFITLADGTTALQLTGTLKAGTTVITMISKVTGTVVTYNVEVKAGIKVDTFSMTAPTAAVAGESIEIPYTATDVDGNDVSKYSVIGNSTKRPTFTSTTGTVAFVQDYATGKAKLELTGVNTAQKVVITAITPTQKFTTLTVDVKDAAVATLVTGIDKDLVTNVAVGGSFTLDKDSISAQDQYGRTFDLTDKLATVAAAGKYQVVVTKNLASDSKISLTGATDSAVINANDASITVAGVAKGTSGLTVKLQKSVNTGTVASPVYAFQDVAKSDYTLNVGVSEKTEFTSYQIKDLTPIYDSADAAYQEALVVYGIKADGSKVVIPSTLYTVSTNNGALTYAGGKLIATNVVNNTDLKDVTAKVTVVVDADGTPVVLTTNAVVTQPTLHATTPTWKTLGNIVVKDGVVQAKVADIANLTNALTLKDQFGASFVLDFVGPAVADTNATVTYTTLKDADGDSSLAATGNGTFAGAITGEEAGDTFNMTVIADGNSYTTPVVVVAN